MSKLTNRLKRILVSGGSLFVTYSSVNNLGELRRG